MPNYDIPVLVCATHIFQLDEKLVFVARIEEQQENTTTRRSQIYENALHRRGAPKKGLDEICARYKTTKKRQKA